MSGAWVSGPPGRRSRVRQSEARRARARLPLSGARCAPARPTRAVRWAGRRGMLRPYVLTGLPPPLPGCGRRSRSPASAAQPLARKGGTRRGPCPVVWSDKTEDPEGPLRPARRPSRALRGGPRPAVPMRAKCLRRGRSFSKAVRLHMQRVAERAAHIRAGSPRGRRTGCVLAPQVRPLHSPPPFRKQLFLFKAA